MIDWPKLLESLNIEYVDSGPSTAKGNIYVHCPWCGEADESYHLGIHLGRGNAWKGYGCWKVKEHRGRAPRRLVAGLLHIGLSQAQALIDARVGGSLPGAGAIQERIRQMKSEKTEKKEEVVLEFLPEMKPIQGVGQGMLFIEYLVARGYTITDATKICFKYKLRYAMSGPFSYRLIFPIWDYTGKLVTWTGRTIADKSPKYRTLTADPFKAQEDNLPQAVGPITDYVWNERYLSRRSGRGLIVCEGPLDALRVDYVCEELGVRATCLFGKVLYERQYDMLANLAPFYEKKYLILDRDASMQSYKVGQRLRACGFLSTILPRGHFNDLGEMPRGDLLDFIAEKTS